MVAKLLFLYLLVVLCRGLDVDKLKLKQVLIFSRHNVRYSLGKELHRYTPKCWPVRKGVLGQLTPRGAYLEGLMGEYFSQWFKKEQFLVKGCPNEDMIYVYTNSINRTKATARAFLDSAFKGCNIPIHHKNTEESDPLFTPVIHNTTEAYKEMVIATIKDKLSKANIKLKPTYTEFNKILDIEHSDICKVDGICDLADNSYNMIKYKPGQEMWIEGPLFIANSALDSFMMSYYDGTPLKDIAWGQITHGKWGLLTEISRQDQFIRYATVAEDIAAPLMENLTQTFRNYDSLPQLILIVGHDYNMNSISKSLGFKSFDVINQYELFPIGGKFVFQRWTDGENDYLKVEYVYGSWSQLRLGTKFTLQDPPQRIPMELNWCNTDNGFCPWNEFVNKL